MSLINVDVFSLCNLSSTLPGQHSIAITTSRVYMQTNNEQIQKVETVVQSKPGKKKPIFKLFMICGFNFTSKSYKTYTHFYKNVELIYVDLFVLS